ncbi:MAG: hypothetical protein FGM15_10890 [Chthoniobacterales bacterium]|nr:hypothetical protein [Chthoniobacterales bacterium]
MTKSKFTTKQSARLGAYFAAGVGASFAATSNSDAAIVNIGIGTGPGEFNMGGTNAGVSLNSVINFYNFPFAGGGTMNAYNFPATWMGLAAAGGLYLAIDGGNTSPRNFSSNTLIDGSATWSSHFWETLFRYTFYDTTVAPDFGPGSYIGFRNYFADTYGWLEVTWSSTANEFQILSGAYEEQPGVGILAGARAPIPEPVPEPGTWAAAALLAGGAAFARWRKRRDEAQKEAA